MPVATEPPNTSETAARDRRRPGRVERVSPELIPLLRKEQRDAIPVNDPPVEAEGEDQLSAARGILVGLGLSVPLWVGIAYVVRWILD